MNPPRTRSEKRSVVSRNERMTALAGAILFVLIIVELVVTANLHSLISVHIFIGVLLCGPLVVKLSSTGYRFFRYYTKSPAFVQKGAPHPLLRLLAPLLVIITLAVFISGFGLAVLGPNGLLFKIHAASVALWLPLLAVHIYAYIRKVPSLIATDWSPQSSNKVFGRSSRLKSNLIALIIGAVAAIVMIPVSRPWNSWRIHHGVPSPLTLGIIAAIVAVVVAVPLLRKTKKVRL